MCFAHVDFEMCFAPQQRDISTSKSGPNMVCFSHFDFEMCFVPLRRALFEHHNFQKCSEPDVILISTCESCHSGVHCFNVSTSMVFLAVWLPNALRATGACTFLASQLPKVVQTCGSFYMLTSKCTSRHNAMHFFDISTSKSAPTLKHHVCKCFNMFNHVYFDMCFGPQRRALFDHISFQKRSENAITTMVCTFSTSPLTKIPPEVRCF